MGHFHRPTISKLAFFLFCFASCANSLYEDQVGKFDWHQKYLGHVKFIVNDANQPKRVLVGTKDSVIGAINSNTGAILYRHVLEAAGELKYFGNYESKYVLAVSTVQDQIKIRKLETTTGVLAEESAITGDISHVAVVGSHLYLIDAKSRLPEVSITILDLEEDEKESKRVPITKKLNLGLGESSICDITSQFLVCVQRNNVVIVSVVDGTVSNKKLEDGFVANEIRTSGAGKIPCVIFVGDGEFQTFHVLRNDKNGPELMPVSGLSTFKYVTLSQGELEEEPVLFVTNLKTSHEIIVEVFDQNLKKLDSQTLNVRSEIPIASLETTKGFCVNSRCGLIGFTHDQLFFGTKIDTKSSSTSQILNVEWNRHEALSSVLAVEMVDFPSELGPSWNPYQSQQDVITAFISRIKYEVETLVLGESLYSSSMDRFGLRKLILLVTSVGKVLGIDSATGTILYSFLLPDFTLLGNSAFLYIQRPAKFAPLKPQATVIYASSREVSATTVLYAFNPVDGKPLDQPQTYPQVLQTQMLLHGTEETKFLKPILLLDINHIVHSYPSNIPTVSNSYFFLAEKSPPVLQGFGIRSIHGSTKLQGKLLWELNLGPGEVIGVHGKLLGERVHSQGRVLPDRSVSYKYMNPNVVVVVTAEHEAANINVFLIDAVSGSVIHSFWHKKCRGPVHVVHSEHWVVYSLFSEKSRRFEINSVELYEGQSQSNSTVFSSFASPVIQPIVVKQSYVFPTGIHAMAHTRTEKGITNKDVLIAIPSGGLLELPRMILQPRLTEMIINYNQSLRRVEGIKTWPTRLESTCLVLAHGLDLFYTRVTPSKTFDVLKDDFDHWFITVVLAGLVAGAYVAKRFSAKKQLEQAWR
ncbi:unnamed protein product [Allacma fusca]|uniref:ER membrane protein complex subunit 1 n=1 Tax=Allacma fusca TaxID=39272 RepID=A0A8J2JZ65_9HEXA|nr:unnamed protein product [Allacma fusca]